MLFSWFLLDFMIVATTVWIVKATADVPASYPMLDETHVIFEKSTPLAKDLMNW